MLILAHAQHSSADSVRRVAKVLGLFFAIKRPAGKRLVFTSKLVFGGASTSGTLVICSAGALNLPSITLKCMSQCARVIGCSVAFHVRLAASSRILRGTCTRCSIVDTRHAMQT